MAVLERMEAEGVEGIKVGRFAASISTACIVYRVGSTVVDTGPPNQWAFVRKFLEERQVQRVVVTHHHEDHSGNLAAIGRRTNAALHSPRESIAPLSTGFPLRLYQHIMWGRPATVQPLPLPERIPLEGGGSLQPIPAPGHSSDMTCFLEPGRGWLFTGDLYIASRTRYLRIDEDLKAQIESLRQILQLDFDTLFCAHRGVIRQGKQALEAKLDYLVSFCQQVRELHAQGLEAAEITRRLLGREDLMSWITGFHFSKRNLIRACLAC